MRPPICFICKKRFDPRKTEGGLVYFKLSKEEAKHNERFKKEGFVGHPEGREWFCEKHIQLAKRSKNSTLGDLRQKIRDEEE